MNRLLSGVGCTCALKLSSLVILSSLSWERSLWFSSTGRYHKCVLNKYVCIIPNFSVLTISLFSNERWHHITVLNAVWITSFHFDPVGRWFGIVNLGVHALMYSYYALKVWLDFMHDNHYLNIYENIIFILFCVFFQSVNIYVPKKVAMTITVLQLAQMVWAVYLNLYSIYLKRKFKNMIIPLTSYF